MDDVTRKILLARRAQAEKAGSLFLEAFCGKPREVGKKLAVETARELGHSDVASIIDADFEEERE